MPLSRPRALLLLAVILTPRLAHAQLYSLIDLGDLPGGVNRSDGYAISNNSFAVGTSAVGIPSGSTGHPYLWNPGNQTMTDLGVLDPNNDWGNGAAVSDTGTVVGWAGHGTSIRAFSWDSSNGMTNLGDLPGGVDQSQAHGVNNAGFITGCGTTTAGKRAFVRNPQTQQMVDIGDLPGGGTESQGRDINSHGYVVGWADAATGDRGFLWNPNTQQMTDLGDLPGGADRSYAYALNRQNYVVGESAVAGAMHAFFWDPQTQLMYDLGELAGGLDGSVAYDISFFKHVVGMSQGPNGKAAFLWTPLGGMIDLNNHLDGSGAGWNLQYAYSVNDLGEIVGTGIDPQGNTHGYMLRLVPAPSSLALIGIGALLRRRHQAR